MHVGVGAVKLKLQGLQLTLRLGNLEFMCLTLDFSILYRLTFLFYFNVVDSVIILDCFSFE